MLTFVLKARNLENTEVDKDHYCKRNAAKYCHIQDEMSFNERRRFVAQFQAAHTTQHHQTATFSVTKRQCYPRSHRSCPSHHQGSTDTLRCDDGLVPVNSGCYFKRTLWGCLHGGRKILEGGTTFRWVYTQKLRSVWLPGRGLEGIKDGGRK